MTSGNLVVCLFDAQPIYEDYKMIGAFGQFRDISDRYLLQEKYNYLAYHDDLTNLPNRRYINREVETIITGTKSRSPSDYGSSIHRFGPF